MRDAWDHQVRVKNVWTLPVSSDEVARPRGTLLSGIVNPVVFTADLALEREGIMHMRSTAKEPIHRFLKCYVATWATRPVG